MANDLVTPAELAGFPGAPFTDAQVDAAVQAIRNEAGWHIAPAKTETLVLDAEDTQLLLLPTLLLTTVSEIRDMTEDPPVVLDEWRMSTTGMLWRDDCWPCGFQSVEADVTHGYATCPADLLPVIAEYARMTLVDGAVASATTGPFSVTYRAPAEMVSVGIAGNAIMAFYSLPVRQR